MKAKGLLDEYAKKKMFGKDCLDNVEIASLLGEVYKEG